MMHKIRVKKTECHKKAANLLETLFTIPRKNLSLLFLEWQNVALLEQEEDVNQLTEFFSYEHFYVIYCKFWELDTDHDLYIDQRDLAQHNDQGTETRRLCSPPMNATAPSRSYWKNPQGGSVPGHDR